MPKACQQYARRLWWVQSSHTAAVIRLDTSTVDSSLAVLTPLSMGRTGVEMTPHNPGRRTGTAEREQNGVTTPSHVAATSTRPSRDAPTRNCRARSIVAKLRRRVTMKVMPPTINKIFAVP